jgi:intein-encoded DNA endonuclease-like protein
VTKEELAYISGFLDGDGCIMLQLVFRHDYLLGYQIRASVVFYQKQQNRYFLEWLREKFNCGYIRNRNDGMSEYTIVGGKPVSQILNTLLPYLRLKKKQAELAISVLEKMPGSGRKMNAKLLAELALEVDKFAVLNYSKRRINTTAKVLEFLESQHLLIP